MNGGRALLLFMGAMALALTALFLFRERRPVPLPGDPRGAGTLMMAQRLAEIVEEIVDDEQFKAKEAYMLTDLRLPWRREQVADALGDDDEPLKRRLLARELVQCGDPLAALAEFDEAEKAFIRVRGKLDEETSADLQRWRAVTWLRLGEVENCLGHHSCASCIAPIAASGQHVERRGSEHAFDLYLELVEKYPDDLESRWLLNLAAMTLGRWPEQVPERWRIGPEVFASSYDIHPFRDVAVPAGLGITTLAGGACVEDFDQDGFLDVMTSSLGLRDQARYFKSNGDGTFTERTKEAGLEGEIGGLNMVHADYDNDGDADVLILRGAWMGEVGRMPSSLLRNRGDGSFDDVTEEAGLLSFHPTQTAQWADLDNDGWLDLVIGNETQGPDHPHPCELFLSRRDGTFAEVGEAVGADVLGWVKGVAAGDYDNDGRVDLYYSKRESDNVLLHNERSDRAPGFRFRDVTAEAGVAAPRMSFPTWFFDYDNDGRLDLFVAGNGLFTSDTISDIGKLLTGAPLEDVPCLYHNEGGGRFKNVAYEAGVERAVITMGSNFGDLDNDGWPDFYLGNGAPSLRALLPNRAFRNDGGKRFQDVTTSGGFGHLQKGHAVAFADLDNDGDQDLYLEVGGAVTGDAYPTVVYENPGHGNHWLTLRLRGVQANRAAIGARVRVDVVTPAGPRSIHHVVGTGGSFGSSSLQAELGLGDATSITAIEILWPGSGNRSRFEGAEQDGGTGRTIGMDRAWLAVEGARELAPVEQRSFQFPAGAAPCHVPPTPPVPGS